MAQFGSAPALGAGGRRFESSHPDMTEHLLYLLAILTLVISNALSIIFIYRYYIKTIEYENKIFISHKEQINLEEFMFQIEEDNKKLKLENKKLIGQNKELKLKIDKINNQVKQISKHFKTN